MSFRLCAVLALVLLVVAAVYALQGEGRESTVFGSWITRARGSWMGLKTSVIKDTPARDAAADSNVQVKFSSDNSDAGYESQLLDSLEVGYSDDARAYLSRDRLNQIRTLIRDGAWTKADGELDRARRMYPDSPEVLELYEEYRSGMSATTKGKAGDARAPSPVAGDNGGATGETTAAPVYVPNRESGSAVTAANRGIPGRGEAVGEVHRFAAGHGHGLLRGDCSGELLLDHSELEYRTLSGDHDFSIPVKIIKIKREGQIIRLLFLSSSELFKELELATAGEALRFTQTWESLKSPSLD